MNIKFTGFVDKILYKKDGLKTYIAIIDYKTGKVSTDLTYLQEGFGMQLPIYLYLVKKSSLFDNPEIIGFYLQFVLNQEVSQSDKVI